MRNFGIMKRAAENERRHSFNPEAGDPPYGDWAHIDIKPLRDLDRCANHDFAVLVLGGVGFILAVGAIVCVAAAIWLASMVVAWPRDLDGHYATQDPALHAWFDQLASGKGLCCSFADGKSISDVDWDTQGPNNTYRVRIDGKWIDVPPDAVVTEPNKFGPAVVWPYDGVDGVTLIRCFLPGAGA